MVEDVRLAVNGASPVHFHGRTGGMVPTRRKSPEKVRAILKEVDRDASQIVYRASRGPDRRETHYCPGCHHGIIHRLIAEVLVELEIARRDRGRLPRGLHRVCGQLLRLRHDRGRPRPRAGGRHGHQARPPRTASSSPIRATATWPPSAPPRSSTPPCRGEKHHHHLRQQRDLRHDRRPDGPDHPARAEDHHLPAGPRPGPAGFPIRMSEMLATLDGMAFCAARVRGRHPQPDARPRKPSKRPSAADAGNWAHLGRGAVHLPDQLGHDAG